MSWQDRGNCLGSEPELFFPLQGQTQSPAKKICEVCEVRVECLEYALAEHEPGIYGQTSERERRTIRRMGISALDYLTGLDNGTIQPPRRGRPNLTG